jgi:hypothetical protein
MKEYERENCFVIIISRIFFSLTHVPHRIISPVTLIVLQVTKFVSHAELLFGFHSGQHIVAAPFVGKILAFMCVCCMKLCNYS